MSELSNALRQRLAAREEPRVHPDPDSLTAYLEQLLSPLERDRVVEHLAVCRQCRDVVALSMPEQPAIEAVPAVALPVRRSWRSWILGKPALGLAASLGALAIVATLVIELPRGSVQRPANQPVPFSSASTNVPAASPAPAEPDNKQPGLTSPPAANSTLRDAETRVASASKAPPPLPADVTTTRVVPAASDSSVGGPYVNTQMFANDASNTITSQNELPAAPAPRITGDRQNSLPLTENDQLSRADAPYEMHSGKPLRILSPATSASRFGLSMVTTLGHDAKQIFRKPAAPPLYAYGFVNHAMGGAGQFNPAKETGPSAEVTAAAPVVGGRDGAELEQSHALTARARSLAGADRASGAVASTEMAKKAESAPSAWKVGDSKLLKLDDSGAWSEGYSAGEGIEFFVVSAHGSDVWAGGSNAALVHSHDGGANWERITLGSTANGTITSIEAGALKIQVKSSSGQSWSSPDGGKTWVLQD